MEEFKNFKQEDGTKVKIWGGGHFAKWLNYKKFEDKNVDLKLPQIANEAEKTPGYNILSKVIKIGCKTAIEISKKI